MVRNFRRPGASAAAVAIVMGALLVAAAAGQVSAADAAPYFLVATKAMPDSMFAQSVVLVLPSTDIPIVAGVIINKPTTVMVRELFPNLSGIQNQTEVAYLGGPVDADMPAAIARGAEPPANAARIMRDIYISTDRNSIAKMLASSRPTDLRVIVGRAQWTRDQLRAEISEGAWYVVPAEPELIFSDPQNSGICWWSAANFRKLKRYGLYPALS